MRSIICFFLILLLACSEQEDHDSFVQVQDAQGDRVFASNDPNLNPNWNWEGSQWPVYIKYDQGISSLTYTPNPFYNNPVFGNNVSSLRDMRKSQGWILVARDFGTPTAAPTHPWLMLYNK